MLAIRITILNIYRVQHVYSLYLSTKHVHSAKREGDYDTDIRVHSSHMMTKGDASGWCCLSPNHIRVRLLIFFSSSFYIYVVISLCFVLAAVFDELNFSRPVDRSYFDVGL